MMQLWKLSFNNFTNGNVLACRRVKNSKVGNIFTDDLDSIWLGEMEEFRNYKKFKKCSKCEVLAWYRGCPAVAFSKNGNFYAPDPQCWKEVV